MIYKVYNEKTELMLEHNTSRMINMIKRKIPFGIVSAYRTSARNMYEEFGKIDYKELSPNEQNLVNKLNEENHNKLKQDIISLVIDIKRSDKYKGHGYVELMGKYNDTGISGEGNLEESICIAHVPSEDLIALGNKYNQLSVLYYGEYKGEWFFGTIPCDYGNSSQDAMKFNHEGDIIQLSDFQYGFSQYLDSFRKQIGYKRRHELINNPNPKRPLSPHKMRLQEPKANKFSYNMKSTNEGKIELYENLQRGYNGSGMVYAYRFGAKTDWGKIRIF